MNMKEERPVNEEQKIDRETREEKNEGEEIEVDYENRAGKGENQTESEEAVETEESKVEALEKELEEQKDKLLRLAAEFDNYKKRTAREYANLIESANLDLIRSLLDILDNFRRALASAKDADADAIFKGMEMIYNQFDSLLKERGLEEIEAEGQPFDPELHEAVMTTPTDEVPEDYVASEMQKGYRIKGRVVRHSKVAVAKPPEE
ncbi:MAG: nucleotide exchange factor GrpE [candidate division Zixibacteria bacterium]|nr:nucleotide exchange factor GrpE [candidate division Zixibacteria bacterium]